MSTKTQQVEATQELRDLFPEVDWERFEVLDHIVANSLYHGDSNFEEYLGVNFESDMKQIADSMELDAENVIEAGNKLLKEFLSWEDEPDFTEYCLKMLKELIADNNYFQVWQIQDAWLDDIEPWFSKDNPVHFIFEDEDEMDSFWDSHYCTELSLENFLSEYALEYIWY